MDIEGSEFTVIKNILKSNILIRQILVETHERFLYNGRERIRDFFKILHDHGYRVFRVSDTSQEVSLIKT